MIAINTQIFISDMMVEKIKNFATPLLILSHTFLYHCFKIKNMKLDDISVVQKRLEILWSARLRNKSKSKEAIKIQDQLSKKSSKEWSGAEEIRKWREKR